MTHIIKQTFTNHLSLIVLLLIGLAITTRANATTGINNSPGALRLNASQLQQVQTSLRHKTGFVELGFDDQGVLTPGNRLHVVGGSATARALLLAAVDGPNQYELESHENSPEVAFARLTDSAIYENGEQRVNIYQLIIDFADFHWLEGAAEAKAAFDVGFNVLHELTHGVLRLPDPQGEMDRVGACAAHVNQMRRELHLPERLYYHPDIMLVRLGNLGAMVRASLQFIEPSSNGRPHARYDLWWLASKVALNARNVTELEKGLVGVKWRP